MEKVENDELMRKKRAVPTEPEDLLAQGPIFSPIMILMVFFMASSSSQLAQEARDECSVLLHGHSHVTTIFSATLAELICLFVMIFEDLCIGLNIVLALCM